MLTVIASEAKAVFGGRGGLGDMFGLGASAIDAWGAKWEGARAAAVLFRAVERWGIAGTVERFPGSFDEDHPWRQHMEHVWLEPAPGSRPPPGGCIAYFRTRSGVTVREVWPKSKRSNVLEDKHGARAPENWGQCFAFTTLGELRTDAT